MPDAMSLHSQGEADEFPQLRFPPPGPNIYNRAFNDLPKKYLLMRYYVMSIIGYLTVFCAGALHRIS